MRRRNHFLLFLYTFTTQPASQLSSGINDEDDGFLFSNSGDFLWRTWPAKGSCPPAESYSFFTQFGFRREQLSCTASGQELSHSLHQSQLIAIIRWKDGRGKTVGVADVNKGKKWFDEENNPESAISSLFSHLQEFEYFLPTVIIILHHCRPSYSGIEFIRTRAFFARLLSSLPPRQKFQIARPNWKIDSSCRSKWSVVRSISLLKNSNHELLLSVHHHSPFMEWSIEWHWLDVIRWLIQGPLKLIFRVDLPVVSHNLMVLRAAAFCLGI